MMQKLKNQHTIARMARVLGVSRSGYYAWEKKGISERVKGDAILAVKIKEIFLEHLGRYGSPRVWSELQARGISVGKKRVARLMRENAWMGRWKKRFIHTTDSRHTYVISKNMLGRDFQAGQPGQKWVSDITHLQVQGGWLYLTVILDLFDRKIIGWAIADSLEAKYVCDALEMAVKNRMPQEKMLFHSDQGKQYASREFREKLAKYCPSVQQSMSRKGNCWDNACAESYFKTLKSELAELDGKHTKSQVRNAVFEYIEVYYNRRRRHSALNYATPLAVLDKKRA